MRKTIFTIALILVAAFCMNAARVKGSVSCGKERLSGVIVTDGINFTRTDVKGRFVLDASSDADFIYIITPSSYVADWSEGTPKFYIPADSKKFDFRLQKLPGEGTDYSLVAIADPQTKTLDHFAKLMAEPMEYLSAFCTSRAAGCMTVGIALGDMAWDSGHLIFPEYSKGITRAGVPFYPVIGNHDYERELKGDHETSAMYRSFFGPENYAFCIGDDYVIVLDNIMYNTNKKYVEGYSEEVLDFVSRLIAFIPEGSTLYVAGHCPMYRWFKGESYTVNGEKLISMLDKYQVNYITGHTHISNNHIFSDHAMEHNIASLCGTWWVASHCNDGTPGGFKVFDRRDGKLTWRYMSTGHDADFQIETFSPGESSYNPDAVVVNVWDWDPMWSVQYLEDGVLKGDMEQVKDVSPYFINEISVAFPDGEIPPFNRPRPNWHYFKAVPSEGAKSLTVVVKDRFGSSWTETISL